jgi:hypothetical protein
MQGIHLTNLQANSQKIKFLTAIHNIWILYPKITKESLLKTISRSEVHLKKQIFDTTTNSTSYEHYTKIGKGPLHDR